MTILVTGATGTVGRLVVDELVRAGRQVRALTRDLSRASELLPADVEVATASDLGIGDQNARFELSLSGNVMGFSLDTSSQLVMARVGNDLVAVVHAVLTSGATKPLTFPTGPAAAWQPAHFACMIGKTLLS